MYNTLSCTNSIEEISHTYVIHHIYYCTCYTFTVLLSLVFCYCFTRKRLLLLGKVTFRRVAGSYCEPFRVRDVYYINKKQNTVNGNDLNPFSVNIWYEINYITWFYNTHAVTWPEGLPFTCASLMFCYCIHVTLV